jgi:hypothetical protein
VVCGNVAPHFGEWDDDFVPAGAPTLKLVKVREVKVLKVENNVPGSFE